LFREIGVVSRVDKPEAVSLASEVVHFLRKRGLKPIMEDQLASQIGGEGIRLQSMGADLVVVVGGDGTVLRVVHGMKRHIPLFAVRMGRVGFLADVEPEKALEALGQVLAGKFIQDECFTLSTNVGTPNALNEVRVGTETPQQMIELEVYVNDEKIARDRLDALIVATTTGSSGYALSAGGSIVDSCVEAMVIVPVCPLSPNFKPLIVPLDANISIKPKNIVPVIVLVDSQYQKKLTDIQEIVVKKSDERVTFIRTGSRFYERLRRRLGSTSIRF